MVTYLACFIVCDFEYEEKRTEIHNTLFRVYATPTQRERIKYALDIGANITDYFENYFDVSYIKYILKIRVMYLTNSSCNVNIFALFLPLFYRSNIRYQNKT